MKKIKKLFVILLMVCMLCPSYSMISYAAAAELRFTDPSTTVGAEVEVTAKMSSSATLNTVEATLSYDPEMLKFISGDNATGGDGTINLAGNGESTTIEFILKFQALKEGTTNIEVERADGIDSSGVALQITCGSSAVSIGPGDPSLITDDEEETSGNGKQVVVDDEKYVISNDFSETIIPEGFVKSEMKFEGETYQVIAQETSGTTAMYLAPVLGGDSDFFLYDDDNGTFSPMEEVEISNGRYIIPLRDDGSINLPERYQKTSLKVNGKEFDTWQDTENEEYYIIYALNADGERLLYQHDTIDKTYQRYNQSLSITDSSSNQITAKGIWGKFLRFFENFLDIAVILVLAVIFVLLIILIIVGIKLHHRNLELDDLYDEYGIDAEEEDEEDEDEFEEPVNARKSSAKKAAGKGKKKDKDLEKDGPAVRKPVREVRIEEEDDFEVFEPEPLDEEAFDNFEGYFGNSEYDDEGYDGSDDFIDDTTDLLSSHPEKKRGHAEVDDTFKMDIIDLD